MISPDLPLVSDRVQGLFDSMTLDEKLAQLVGFLGVGSNVSFN